MKCQDLFKSEFCFTLHFCSTCTELSYYENFTAQYQCYGLITSDCKSVSQLLFFFFSLLLSQQLLKHF